MDYYKDQPILINELKFEEKRRYCKIALNAKENIIAIVEMENNYGEICGYEIWEIRKEGNIISVIDAAAILEEGENCYSEIQKFAIDSNNNYYFKMRDKENIIIYNTEEKKLVKLNEGVYRKAGFEAMTSDSAGRICVLYCETKAAGGRYIFDLYDNGELINSYCGNFFPYDDIYSVIGKGEKFDILVKGQYGVYGYIYGKDKGEKLIALSIQGIEATRSCFLFSDELLRVKLKGRLENGTYENVELEYLKWN